MVCSGQRTYAIRWTLFSLSVTSALVGIASLKTKPNIVTSTYNEQPIGGTLSTCCIVVAIGIAVRHLLYEMHHLFAQDSIVLLAEVYR